MAEIVTKVWIVEDDCTSCEACVGSCPEVFEMGDDTAVVKSEGEDAEFLKANSEGIIQAADECPTEAIKYETA